MKVKAFFFTLVIIAGTVVGTYAQKGVVGKEFPDMKGETYNSKPVELPKDIKGKYTIIGMAYSKSAEADLKTWLSPAYNKFIAKTGLMDSQYDVNIFFIPMFTGTNVATEGLAKKKLKEGTDPKLFPYVIFYKGSIHKYKKELSFNKRNTAYFFVLDKNGKIVYATSGKYSEDKMDAITDKLD